MHFEHDVRVYPVHAIAMPRSRDTTAEADAVQLAVLRRMTAAQRTSLANQMSTDARETTLAAIKARNPNYSDEHARWERRTTRIRI